MAENNVTVLEPPPAAPPPASPPPRSQYGWTASLMRGLPTFLVMVLLAGIGWVGHRAGWKASGFAALLGKGPAAATDWCEEHCVPESICVECDADLLPRQEDHGFCRVHGVPNCPFEHPEVAQTRSLPRVSQEDLARAKRALDLKPRGANSAACKLYHRRIQFASKEVLDQMGVDTWPVSRGPVEESIGVSGEITFADPNVAPVHTNVSGRLSLLTELGQLGQTVKKGDVLAMVDALEVGKARAEFLQALAQQELKSKTVARLRPLVPRGAIPEAQLLEAEAAWQEARIRLLLAEQGLTNLGLPLRAKDLDGLPLEELTRRVHAFGLPEELLKSFEETAPVGNLLPVRAPRDGVLIAVKVAAKETVDPARALFVVADTSTMWLRLHVRQEEVKYLQVRDPLKGTKGQIVRFRPDDRAAEVAGELVWLSKSVDDKTRTLQARADLPNPDGKLLSHTFGTGQILLRREDDALLVPSEAVHWEGHCNVVFVRDKNFNDPDGFKVFHVRGVRVGVPNVMKDGLPHTEIIAGVLPGEVVAYRNSAALRGELLKNRLGEG